MPKLYYLLPQVKLASKVIKALKNKGVTDDQLSLIANDKHILDKMDVQEAGLLKETDFLPSMGRGSMVGAAVGLLAGLGAVVFPEAGLIIGGGRLMMFGLTLFGSGFGAWVSSMIGISVPHTDVEKFKSAIDKGGLLLLVDLPKEREEETTRIINETTENFKSKF